MDEFNFSKHSQAFLENDSLGAHVFFQDTTFDYTYRDLISAAINKSGEFENISEELIALKMKSSYLLFVHLLAGLIAKKKCLILSAKEPDASIETLKIKYKFSHLLTDENSKIKSSVIIKTIKEISLDQTAFCILSSGSTAPSKVISLSLNNVAASAESFINYFQMTKAETLLLNLPHHHIGGLMILWRAFFSGGKVSNQIENNFHYISLVPLQLKRWLQDSEKASLLKSCKGILIGGAALDDSLRIKAEELGLKIFETYGMSETCSFVMLNGSPLPNQQIKLSSTHHFLIKGPTLSPDLPLDKEGFYHTKDQGEKLPAGRFKFIGRSDLLFKSAGEMIDPLSLETIIKNIPWIKDAVVVPISHPTWTKASVLIYTMNDSNKKAEDIKNHLEKLVHPHLIPRYFFMGEAAHFSEGMKPKRYDLSQWAQDQYFKTLFNIHYIEKEHSKKLMVVLHGFMEEHTDLLSLVDQNVDCSYLFIDLPGHGKTNIAKFNDRKTIFSELESLIRFYEKDNGLLMYGYSMGGRIAIELAIQIKPKILFLESAHFGLNNSKERQQRLNQDLQLLNNPQLDIINFFNTWYSNPIFGSYKESENFTEEIKKKLSHSPRQWHESLKFFSPGAAETTLQENIQNLKTIRIIGFVGNVDKKYMEHYQEVLKNNLNFKYFIIEGAAHNPHKTHVSDIKNILLGLI